MKAGAKKSGEPNAAYAGQRSFWYPLSPDIVYAGTQNEGLFKSTDYGDTCKSTGSGLSGAITYLTLDPTRSGRLFASTATAFYLSEDGAQSWTNVLNMPAWTVTIDPNRPSTVYATARTQGIFRSSDGGHAWQAINTGLTMLNMGQSAPVLVRGELRARRVVCKRTGYGPGESRPASHRRSRQTPDRTLATSLALRGSR